MGKYPYLYYYNWPETGTMHDDTIACTHRFQWSAAPVASDEYGYYCEYALYQHTDDTIEAIGLAIGHATGNTEDSTVVTLYDSSMNELASFCRSFSTWPPTSDPDAHHFFYPGHVGDAPGFDATNSYFTYVYYIFFKESIFLVGDFYIGVRTGDSTWYCHIRVNPLNIIEWHGAPYNFHSNYKVKVNEEWTDLRESIAVPILFVIQKLPCDAVDTVTVEVGADGCLTADWERVALQSAWTVMLTLPDGSTVVQPTDTNHWQYCGLAPNQRYTVQVRSRCDDLNGYSWSDWSDGFSYEPPQGVDAPGSVAFALSPNPASGTVGVECAAAEGTLEVVDMQGRTVLTAPATQRTLDLRPLAAGSYIVRLTTPDGTATRHLQVE